MSRNILELKTESIFSESAEIVQQSLQKKGYDFEPWFCDPILQEKDLENKVFWSYSKTRKGYVPVDKIVGCNHGHIERGETWLSAFENLHDSHFLDQQEFRDFIAGQETSGKGESITLHQYGDQYFFIFSGRHRILNSKFLHIPEIFCAEIMEFSFNYEAFSLYSRIKAIDPKAKLSENSINCPISASYLGIMLNIPLSENAVTFLEESISIANRILSIPVYRRIYCWSHPVKKVNKNLISISLLREDDRSRLVPSFIFQKMHTKKNIRTRKVSASAYCRICCLKESKRYRIT